MCFDVELNYPRFIRKQIITVNYSSQLKNRESALIWMAFPTMWFPDTLSVPFWIEGWNAVHYCDALRKICFTSWNLWAKSFLPHTLLPGMVKEAGVGPFCYCLARARYSMCGTCGAAPNTSAGARLRGLADLRSRCQCGVLCAQGMMHRVASRSLQLKINIYIKVFNSVFSWSRVGWNEINKTRKRILKYLIANLVCPLILNW